MSVEISLLVAILALLGNAFFVGAEFALMSVRRSSIELASIKGSAAAKTCLAAMDSVAMSLATIQLGVTLCSLVFGAIAEPIVAHLLVPVFQALSLPAALVHPAAFGIAVIVMVSLHVVIGEMVPKNVSLANPTTAALRLVPLLYRIAQAVGPVVTALNMVANGTLRLLGLTPQHEVQSSFSRDEVAGFVKESRRVGLISSDEALRLTGSLSFDSKTVEGIIIPITKTIVAHDATPRSIRELGKMHGFSRFPVADKKGNLIGYVHLKDMITLPSKLLNGPVPKECIRPLGVVAPITSLLHALTAMRSLESHVLQVKRSTKTVGLVMLEDVLEELVGPINSPHLKKKT
ncbi:MAG: hemolysin family protein [Candidatus Saccharimonas sp.]